ncbi:SIS domain-containing protein [Enterobacillus tribolii]|uniref:Galactosamine 6-phosphate isomerase AgaS n=1 Tax=Enterobacillus tribolii TaxID=1487935 RepID=A0A370Q4K6_9GAMM|nr:SIS domain-containing protein [Enterobacillus tribolii]MBW7985073.1 SIS domain-containing protein [Enterobacillus tribolii]RDK83301.1 galactosamine 6-phosphate isomerase AgaS [Enterobacillus tribolii]
MSEIRSSAIPTFSTWTEGEIRQQPDMWLRALQDIETRRAALDAFLRPVLAQENLKIIFTGAGTSAFIGDIIVPWLSPRLDAQLAAIPTTDIVTNPADYLPQDRPVLLVSFARSGNSPESVAAVSLTNQCVPHCHHLIITCNEGGALCRHENHGGNAFVLLMPPETNDRGFAMTSSISSMMAGGLAVFAPDEINAARFASLAARCRDIITSLGDFSAGPFGEMPYRRVAYLGSGCLQGVAREASLKVLELTAGQVAAFYDSPVGFRHGPKSLVNDETLVVVFISAHPYTRLYDLDLLTELRRDKQAMRVVAISAQRNAIVEEGEHIYIPGGGDVNDIELAFCFLIYAQIFALTQSVKAGITPDSPSVNGTVNRVVQGVVIHPWVG